MVIALNPEQEQVVGKAIEAGLIEKAEDAVELGMGTIRQRLEVRAPRANRLSHEEWSKLLHDWAYSHSTEAPLLSDEAISRESIYEDRGL
jgi:hypothetical protein